MKKPKIGFIGQGFVGKNTADNFESRGFEIVRYSLEKEYVKNKDQIKTCDIVFIAVPTPTTLKGFNDSIVRESVGLIKTGKVAVIKSTVLPGTTVSIQKDYPDTIVLHAPEFLSEASVKYDVLNPFINIIGIPIQDEKYQSVAKDIFSILPKAPENIVTKSEEAELIKYSHNCSGYTQIIFFNLMYNLAEKLGANWDVIEQAIKVDPFIPNRYARPLHNSGRGAGGHCFPKDFEALLQFYKNTVKDNVGLKMFESIRDKNIELLRESDKDADILDGVYN